MRWFKQTQPLFLWDFPHYCGWQLVPHLLPQPPVINTWPITFTGMAILCLEEEVHCILKEAPEGSVADLYIENRLSTHLRAFMANVSDITYVYRVQQGQVQNRLHLNKILPFKASSQKEWVWNSEYDPCLTLLKIQRAKQRWVLPLWVLKWRQDSFKDSGKKKFKIAIQSQQIQKHPWLKAWEQIPMDCHPPVFDPYFSDSKRVLTHQNQQLHVARLSFTAPDCSYAPAQTRRHSRKWQMTDICPPPLPQVGIPEGKSKEDTEQDEEDAGSLPVSERKAPSCQGNTPGHLLYLGPTGWLSDIPPGRRSRCFTKAHGDAIPRPRTTAHSQGTQARQVGPLAIISSWAYSGCAITSPPHEKAALQPP